MLSDAGLIEECVDTDANPAVVRDALP